MSLDKGEGSETIYLHDKTKAPSSREQTGKFQKIYLWPVKNLFFFSTTQGNKKNLKFEKLALQMPLTPCHQFHEVADKFKKKFNFLQTISGKQKRFFDYGKTGTERRNI